MKKIIAFLLVIVTLFSCQYFEKNVPVKEELLKKELEKVNLKEVDEFPSVLTCDSLTNKAESKKCFFDFMTQNIQQKLANDTLKRIYPKKDTLHLKITIFADAKVKFQPSFDNDSLQFNTFKIDSIIQLKLANFPAVEPAIKRGLKVKSQFVLPILLNSK